LRIIKDTSNHKCIKSCWT